MTDWQDSRAFEDTNLHLLEEGPLYDVTFLLGTSKTEVKAHRNILASRSVVFHAMFCGSLAESSSQIEIPDIEEDTFRSLLRFIYTEDCKVIANNVMSMLYAAKKYGLKRLREKCLKFLANEVAVENVCTILTLASQFDERDMIEKCMSFIFENSRDVLKSEGFLDLPKELLYALLESNDLAVEESIVYEACIDYAKKQKMIEEDTENVGKIVRDALGDLLYLIRFPQMDQEYFSSKISRSDVLTENEKIEIFQTFFNVKPAMPRFNLNPRHIVRHFLVERFEEDRIQKGWGNGCTDDGIGFSVHSEQAMFLTGVSMFSPVFGDMRGIVYVSIGNEIMISKRFICTVGGEKYFDVIFDNTIELSPGQLYKLYHNASGRSFYGTGGKGEVKCDDVLVRFHDGYFPHSCVAKGQFHGLILSCYKY